STPFIGDVVTYDPYASESVLSTCEKSAGDGCTVALDVGETRNLTFAWTVPQSGRYSLAATTSLRDPVPDEDPANDILRIEDGMPIEVATVRAGSVSVDVSPLRGGPTPRII